MSMLRVKRIRIHNVLGIEDLEITPGKVTVITGRNGAGKTSIISSIRHAIEGGKDATLIRKGETAGRTVIEFDDETTLQRRYYADGTDALDVTHPILGKTTGAKTWAKRLVHALSLNPIDFITQPTKRVAWMLEANPVPVPVEEIGVALGFLEEDDGPPALEEGEAESHALPVLNRIEKKLFADRTELNRTIRDKEGTEGQMAEVMPPSPPDGDWEGRAAEFEAAAEKLRAEKAERLRGVEAECTRRETFARERHTAAEKAAEKQKTDVSTAMERQAQEKIDAIKDRLRLDLEAVKGAREAAVKAADSERDDEIAAAQAARDIDRDALSTSYGTEEQANAADLAVARERAATADRRVSAEAMLEHIREVIGEMKDRSERFTAALDAIRALKRQVCENLPIPDSEVVDGEIVVGGIPYDRLPQSRQIRIAVDIAALSAGELGLICVDGLEHLDSGSWPEFVKAAEEKGLQMIVARVADSDLSVTVDPGAAA